MSPKADAATLVNESRASRFPHPARRQWRTNGELVYDACMDEGRKRVLLIAASILAARKLAQYEAGKRVPATMCAISDAVRWAEEIMREIDQRWPAARNGVGAND
jgi:hypothetical protein